MPADRRSQDPLPTWSRSAVACNTCRAKKQRCSGEKPICAHCRNLPTPCVWPQQQRRGPASGYVDALEARLYETEILLKQILALNSEELLQNALKQTFSSHSRPPKSSAAEKRKAVEFWAQHPLRTIEDVYRWRNDLSKEESSPPSEIRNPPESMRLQETEKLDTPYRMNGLQSGFNQHTDYEDYDMDVPQSKEHDARSFDYATAPSNYSDMPPVVVAEPSGHNDHIERSAQGNQGTGAEYGRAMGHSPDGNLQAVHATARSEAESPATNSAEVWRRRSGEHSHESTGAIMGFSKEFQEDFCW